MSACARAVGATTTVISILCLIVFALLSLSSRAPAQTTWNLVWSDEFNGPAGSAPSASNWTYDTGDGGWGNGELEIYCAAGSNTPPCSSSDPNIYEDGNGNLVIKAIKNSAGQWTSGRMKTEGLQNFQYGRIEARMKLTVGDGLWPAFWMLGSNINSVGWPTCGEQDIMEWVQSYGPSTTSSTIHGPGYSGANGVGARFTFPNGGRIDDASYHTYGVIWSANEVQYYRDDYTKPFLTITPTTKGVNGTWVFNQPFFILLNLAIGGGGFPGTTDSSTPNPATMLVDYVRVYKPATTGATDINAGGPLVSPFVADEDFSGGGTISHSNTIDLSKVTNPAPMAVYQTGRDGNFSYTIGGFTPGSSHLVRLHFAETYWSAAGQRTFNVSINGTQVLADFDIFKTAGGKNIANIQQFTENANSSGQYVIQFTTVVNNSLVNGIEIQ